MCRTMYAASVQQFGKSGTSVRDRFCWDCSGFCVF